MDYENPKIRTFKESVKAVPLASPLVGAFRAWKRVKWTLFKEMYRKRYGEYLHHNGMRRPVMLSCETVNICSNDCVFCGYGKMEREKSVMPLKLFEKVLKDYSDLGGGALSLTPLMGDVFMDELLVERMLLTEKYERITSVSFTTNAAVSDCLDDGKLGFILKRVGRVSLSVYGLDPEEHRVMTRRDNYERTLENMRRIIRLAGDTERIRFGFRFFKSYSESEVRDWMLDKFGVEAPYNRTNSYFNWAGSVDTSRPLPFDGEWVRARENRDTCFMPMLGRVLSSGKVTFCHCDDSDAGGALSMGNIAEKSLSEIYGSDKVEKLWNFEENGPLPSVCKWCTFHRPLNNLPSNEFVFKTPLDFIGA